MAKVLVLKSSIMGDHSQTSRLIDAFLKQRVENGVQDEVIIRDLTTLNLPVLDAEIFHALRGAENVNATVQQIVQLSDELIAELKAADLLLIGAPMYNLNVPTQLKNWFDLVARARHTFRYTETYPQGLVENVKAIVMSSRGGIHLGQMTDAVTPYLRSVLGLMGIHEVDFVYAEGLDISALKADALKDAHLKAQQMAV
ncbi:MULTISPECIES: FMN-dependent NADH-azoreductase [Acinetobacter]|jgi:FMN-dependent NADH-azoreductase|uniref:FMN dependent NADH:quinone oxidoreductase n=1 Tax=Acinetobacter courvalinii TaxID=280147 RepID=N9PVN1_9GAMM|nr:MULTISPECIES: NAD(P)H-dependent oxidoreductase [Acinetobacter]RSN81598.1 FMN-dependent NADH-azoreductase [Acinetobacter baumannii]ENX37539.1 FMN-dependent NADH-azoreductase 4 [Acinetobacter courvalinii]KAB0658886.1 FMN-dependent NADH-azoreductase [Acinetobacter courvalinii]MEB3792289.1 NAD(P)H-dependent oxidoreductase [Acinetobacter sp. IK40]GGH26715.1 FMN-dependent NADH-azoreductase [Acinetobacter courvalinii]